MGNEDEKFKKCRRKIRIRLVDPSNPNSYICEVFDSSLENDEKDSDNDNFSPRAKERNVKPKNYFELLMSKDCRQRSKVKFNGGIEENCEQPTVIKLEEKRKNNIQPENRENGKRVFSKPETDSSDDENLLQIKNKFQSQNANPEVIVVCDEETVPKIANSEEDLFTVFDSPKVDPGKKTLSILNYFSKTSPADNGIAKDFKKSDEIKNSKISQRRNGVVAGKSAENSNLPERKLCLNEVNKENVKLAPLFCKREKKIFDSAAQKARLDFLYRSSSTVKKAENKSNDSDSQFPEVVHVQQRNCSRFWSARTVDLPLRKFSYDEDIRKSDRIFRLWISNPAVIDDAVECPEIKINKDILNKLKSKYLNLHSVIDNLKRKRDEYLSLAGELENWRNSTKNTGNDDTGFEALNTLWIEKYKPSSEDILGNGKALKKLRGWLESWKSFDEVLKAFIKSKPKNRTESDDDNDDDDDDAFLDSDDGNCGLKPPGNVCVLSGPHASGKTSLVFALASELEFKVLELNASSKRTGKKVLSDLQEATLSHKVHHVNVCQNAMSPGDTSKRKKKKRKKGKKSEIAAKLTLPNNADCKISLILIEDADVVFEEHDEGFISAITSLVQTSKRPIIFVTQDPNCPYLENFKKDQCLILEMERPSVYKSCAVLHIVSLLEGAHTEEGFLKHLVGRNSFDLRKSLLELQFWTQCKGNTPKLQRQFDLVQLWWGLGKFLYKKQISHYVRYKGFKRKRQNDLFDSSDDGEESVVKKAKLNSGIKEKFSVLNRDTFSDKPNPVSRSYFQILDVVSTVDTFLLSSCSESIFGFECRPKDGLSLEENLEEVSNGRTFTEEISEELVRLSIDNFAKILREKKNENRKFNFESPTWEEIRWQESQTKANEELSALVSLQSGGDKRCLRLDYLPLLRNICRVEKNRSELQPKRKNRYYHYLSNLGMRLENDHLDANCDILSKR